MTFTEQQIQAAQGRQNAAANDPNPQVRLIAGPGTGKSTVIGKRILWLLQHGISPNNIFVISFTRASAIDLQKSARKYCVDNGRPDGEGVSISTLHSLALRVLRTANLLTYPGNPCILDDWELINIIDKEFSNNSGYKPGHPGLGYPPGRCKDIRREYEAFCGTGQWKPANFIPPDVPITTQESDDYRTFHLSRTQIYSCLLPGEIVQQCLNYMRVGTLNPANLLNIQHLIVDEYQDLNPVDIEFIDWMTNNGVKTFVAGDDDQSIYSFRFASPQGIQLYQGRFLNATTHSLQDCFRCTPIILNAAQTLINVYKDQNRAPKQIASLYANSNPPVNGIVHLWQFQGSTIEARSIARSISLLIRKEIAPKDIIILLSNSRIQLQPIIDELGREHIPFDSPREKSFFDTEAGRFIIGMLRAICHSDDYLAYRLILGSRPNIGPATCNTIAILVSSNNLNYQNIFCCPLPDGVFPPRLRNVLDGARKIYSTVSTWQTDDQLQNRGAEFTQIIQSIFGQNDAQVWSDSIAPLPPATRLQELLDYVLADTTEQKENIIKDICSRLQIPNPAPAGYSQKVQIMTMHGAKGLNAKIVFIPGLEDEILPGSNRNPYNGLVHESARMLYVSITRARAACVISFAHYRRYFGENKPHAPSRFTQHLNGVFDIRASGLTDQEADTLVQTCSNL